MIVNIFPDIINFVVFLIIKYHLGEHIILLSERNLRSQDNKKSMFKLSEQACYESDNNCEFKS